MPDYGCCCLGSLLLTAAVNDPFTERASLDEHKIRRLAGIAVRMLDNVLTATKWPLTEQETEAVNKRRIGLGFLGLGDALVMLGVRYDSEEGRAIAASVSLWIRDAAYSASIELAKERGAFPLFRADSYLDGGFASRLPDTIKRDIRKYGIRNSHLTSIAPTGTIALAFADNASNGIEPAFSWFYNRAKRMPDGSKKDYVVEDHAYRVYRAMGGDTENLPGAFVSALDISAADHMLMVAAVAPYVDAAISKTVNVPEDYPYNEFKDLYFEAWRKGLKGITTYRPNSVLGAVLSLDTGNKAASVDNGLETSDPDRRVVLKEVPQPALASLRWPGRPELPHGNPSWTAPLVKHDKGDFAVFIGHVDNGRPHPFEIWVNGDEQPRVLGAIAKTLSMDMRTDDPAWLKLKLDSLAKTAGDDGFSLQLGDDTIHAPSLVAGLARIVEHRMRALGVYELDGSSPMVDALFSRKEPKAGPDGTLAWIADVLNPATGDDLVIMVKECILPNGQRRPFSVWLTGEYPPVMDGLTKLLSVDMRVIDPAWIGMKLRKLLTFREPRGDFWARVPGSEKSECYPSTVAYIATLLLHRYAMLGILTPDGNPVDAMGVLQAPAGKKRAEQQYKPMAGKKCHACGQFAVVKRDGCHQCDSCGAMGDCG